jgi:hypothetical protein
MSIEEQITKKGLNRRDLIKKGAAAGAVFWAIPVIESITSAASATSGTTTGPVSCSWVYIIYLGTDGKVYAAGYSNTGGTNNCLSYGANPNHGVATATSSFNGITYAFIMNQGSPGGPQLITYTTTANPLPTSPLQPPNCNALLQSGTGIQAQNGAVILAFFFFGGQTNGTQGGAPASPQADNTITVPSAC